MIRTRMAPSPTGWLHVGTARTALFNYLFTRKQKGVFVLRMEDTDTERSSKQYEDNLISGLSWLGISWDEFYRQSERIDMYEKYVTQFLNERKAFYCAHTKEDLEQEKHDKMERKEAPYHRCSHRDEGRTDGIIRFRNDFEGDISFQDEIRGTITVQGKQLGDFSIARSTRSILFNLANVIDDINMQITHVIRGEDHIPNTPRQILLLQALESSVPVYAHLPLILGPDRSKLSKRHGETALTMYKDAGYLPEALVNFMALLGWSPGGDREIFSLDELVDIFTLENVQKGGAIFNIDKLTWMNSEYIRALPLDELHKRLIPFLEKESILSSSPIMNSVITIEQSRLKTLADITKDRISFFFEDPLYSMELLRWRGSQDIKNVEVNLTLIKKIIHDFPHDDEFSEQALESLLMPLAKERGVGDTLWPLRVALSGKQASPGPFEIMSIIGKPITLRRIQNALLRIQKNNEE